MTVSVNMYEVVKQHIVLTTVMAVTTPADNLCLFVSES